MRVFAILRLLLKLKQLCLTFVSGVFRG